MGADRLLPIDVSPEAEVVRAVDDLTLRVEAVRLALEAAARDPEPFSDDERTLRRLLDERDASCTAVGVAVAKLLAAGGTIAPRAHVPFPTVPETDPDDVVTIHTTVETAPPAIQVAPIAVPTPEPPAEVAPPPRP